MDEVMDKEQLEAARLAPEKKARRAAGAAGLCAAHAGGVRKSGEASCCPREFGPVHAFRVAMIASQTWKLDRFSKMLRCNKNACNHEDFLYNWFHAALQQKE